MSEQLSHSEQSASGVTFEDGKADSGQSWGWRAWDSGHWEAFYGANSASGNAPGRDSAEIAAQSWLRSIRACTGLRPEKRLS